MGVLVVASFSISRILYLLDVYYTRLEVGCQVKFFRHRSVRPRSGQVFADYQGQRGHGERGRCRGIRRTGGGHQGSRRGVWEESVGDDASLAGFWLCGEWGSVELVRAMGRREAGRVGGSRIRSKAQDGARWI